MSRFHIVPEDSKVSLEMRTSLHPIRSTTTGLEGWVDVEVDGDGRLDLTVEPRGRLELQIDRLSSGSDLYDREMRRRVDSSRYPAIKGELTTMHGVDSSDAYRVRGDLTFHGVTREYEDEMSIEVLDGHELRLEGQRVFDIQEFNVAPPRIMMLKVHPDVSVHVRIVARRDPSARD